MLKILYKVNFLIVSLFVLVFSGKQFCLADEYSVIAPLADQSLLLDGVSVNDKLVVVGERGHILVSTDGHSWKQSSVPTRSTLTGIYFLDQHTGWAVGHDAVILKTTDGGLNWKQVYHNPEMEAPLLDIWFKDSNNGIAIGAYGLYLVSDDGGLTWSQQEMKIVNEKQDSADSPVKVNIDDYDLVATYDLHLNSIAYSETGRLFIVAEAGRVYRSENLGKEWTEVTSPYIGSLFGLMPLEDDELIVFGLRGHLFRSDDAGNSWTRIDLGREEMLTNAIKLQDGSIFICGLSGTILVSEDNARNFSAIDFGTRTGYSALIINKNNELITVGENGVELVGNTVSFR